MHVHPGLPIGMDHLAILAPRHVGIEAQAFALGALGHGIARLPTEIVDRANQHVAQHASFAVQPPAIGHRRSTAIDTGAERGGHDVTLLLLMVFAVARIACSSTLAPAARSSGLAASLSLWLTPLSQGTKIIAVGAYCAV